MLAMLPRLWLYKINSKPQPYSKDHGDWNWVFDHLGKVIEWGQTNLVPELGLLGIGDLILCYQTDRNELVGIAEVVGWRKLRGGHRRLKLRGLYRLGCKVRPLKESDAKIAAIPALKSGWLKTIYEISPADAVRLLADAVRLLAAVAAAAWDEVARLLSAKAA